MNRYLIKYLRDSATDDVTKKYLDYFKVELDWYIYKYGNHFTPKHTTIKSKVARLVRCFNTITNKPKFIGIDNNILSSITILNKRFWSDLGYNAISSYLQPVGYKNILGNKDVILLKRKIDNIINRGNFNDLYSLSLFEEIENVLHNDIIEYQKYNFKGLCLYTDQYFESKYLIDVFKKIGKPSLVFSHGLPGIYSIDVDNRSDFLMVWGDRIKENYIKAGFNKDKIKVVGNLKYSYPKQFRYLRNSLDNVLVIPCSSILWHQHEWDNVQLIDRSMIILYLYQVQHILSRFNVKHARFRPHPVINIDWVYKYIDTDFYIKDNKPLLESFQESTLVIGSTSTTFLEALSAGVNYLVYEPIDTFGNSLCNMKLVPPFDGSERNLSIAKNKEELEYMIMHEYQVDTSILEGYMQPINTSVIKSILK